MDIKIKHFLQQKLKLNIGIYYLVFYQSKHLINFLFATIVGIILTRWCCYFLLFIIFQAVRMAKIQLQQFYIELNKSEAVYWAGKMVSGRWVIVFKGWLNISQLDVRLKGSVEVNFRIYGLSNKCRKDFYSAYSLS